MLLFPPESWVYFLFIYVMDLLFYCLYSLQHYRSYRSLKFCWPFSLLLPFLESNFVFLSIGKLSCFIYLYLILSPRFPFPSVSGICVWLYFYSVFVLWAAYIHIYVRHYSLSYCVPFIIYNLYNFFRTHPVTKIMAASYILGESCVFEF